MHKYIYTILLTLSILTQPVLASDVRVVDGDTIVLNGERHRMLGYDALELAQQCSSGGTLYPAGKLSTEKLIELIGTDEVTYISTKQGRYKRQLSTSNLSFRRNTKIFSY